MNPPKRVYECVDPGPKRDYKAFGETWRLCMKCADLVYSLSANLKLTLLKALTQHSKYKRH